MNKGTILYVGSFELPDKNAAAHRVLNNAKVFQKLGYDIVFLGITTDSKNVKETIYEGFKIRSLPYPKKSFDWIRFVSDFSEIKKMIDNTPNLVMVNCYNLYSFLLYKTIKYCFIKKLKVVSDVTEWYDDKRPIKYVDTELRMRVLNKKTNGIICISEYLNKYYNKNNVTTIVPPLVDISDEKWESVEQAVKYEGIRLVYSGYPGINKDKLDVVINALHKRDTAPPIIFDIVGLTSGQYLNQYPEHADIISELKNEIVFHGRIEHSDALKLVKEADFQIFIRKSSKVNNAGFPTKFVESMACGTPVITTKISDLEKHLIPGKNGYFVDFEDDTSINSVLSLISRLTPHEIYVMKRYSKSVSEFDYKNYVQNVRDFLGKL